MKVVRARRIGFCFGVRRAARMAREVASGEKRPVHTLGPLIHNPQEVARLASLGVVAQERLEDCTGGVTLVRTHGITSADVERAREMGIELFDATCPRVEAARRHLERFGSEGRHVLLVGDHGHPEVNALVSFATGPLTVVAGPAEIPALPAGSQVGVLAQTTQTPEVFRRVVDAARERSEDVVEAHTICEDAGFRQAEGRDLAAVADAVVVVGGRTSANTQRLAAVCSDVQPRTHLVETAAEIGAIDWTGVDKVVLVSGASTPDWVIDEVEEALSRTAATTDF